MNDLKHVRKSYSWIAPERPDWLASIEASVTKSDRPPLSESDILFALGVQSAGRPDEDSDPSDVFQAHRAAWDIYSHLLRHVIWQAARLRALEGSTPDDSKDLIAARKHIAVLEGKLQRVRDIVAVIPPEQAS